MDHQEITGDAVYRFILHQIDTVPHLEALLLIWRTRPRQYSEEELSAQLFVDLPTIRAIFKDLSKLELITSAAGKDYQYAAKSQYTDALMEALSSTYSSELIRVSTLIHSKAPSAIREFAKAFKFTKDQE